MHSSGPKPDRWLSLKEGEAIIDEGEGGKKIVTPEGYEFGIPKLPPKWTIFNTKRLIDWKGKDPIETTLREAAKERYLQQVSEEVRRELVAGLKRTVRWSNGGQKINPDFQETNLEHVIELLEWCNEMEDFYPALWEEVCDSKPELGDDLRAMLTIHDIGEMHPGIGDMCVSNQKRTERAGLVHKRKESFAAHMMLGKALEEPYSSHYRHLYHRFEKRAADDKLAQLGHMFDKGQASQNVALHVIPFSIGIENYDVEEHFYGSQSNTLKYADKLWEKLKSEAAKNDLKNFLYEKVLQHFFAIEFPLIQAFSWEIKEKFARVLLP